MIVSTADWVVIAVVAVSGLYGISTGFLRGAFSRADVRWKYTKTGMPKNYVVVARKP